EQPPPRAEGERYADEHDECAGIHRMPHERIWTGGNDRLSFGDLNSGCAVAVFPENEEGEQESERDYEPVIERGKDQHPDETERREDHDDLLRWFSLGARPHIHAPFEKF